MSYGVAIVVDPDYGQGLSTLAARLHVWICATPANERAADSYRRDHPDYSLETGVTTFKVSEGESPEDSFLRILGDVDLHHGEYSHEPAWDSLEVYGVLPTPPIRAALAEYEVTDIAPFLGGFTCRRRRAGAA